MGRPYPKGLPIAKTFCPTRRLADVPSSTGFKSLNFSGGHCNCRTATSLSGSPPITCKVKLHRYINWTWITSTSFWSATSTRPRLDYNHRQAAKQVFQATMRYVFVLKKIGSIASWAAQHIRVGPCYKASKYAHASANKMSASCLCSIETGGCPVPIHLSLWSCICFRCCTDKTSPQGVRHEEEEEDDSLWQDTQTGRSMQLWCLTPLWSRESWSLYGLSAWTRSLDSLTAEHDLRPKDKA